MRLARYNSALMIFRLYVLGILDAHGVDNLVFFHVPVFLSCRYYEWLLYRNFNGLVSIVSFTLGW